MCVVYELSKRRPYAVYIKNTMDMCPSFAPHTHRTKAYEINTCSLLKVDLENGSQLIRGKVCRDSKRIWKSQNKENSR